MRGGVLCAQELCVGAVEEEREERVEVLQRESGSRLCEAQR